MPFFLLLFSPILIIMKDFVLMIYDLQKASVLKRISAFLLDFILTVILLTGFMWGISAVAGYDTYSDTLSARMEEIKVEYGVPEIAEKYEINIDSFANMTEEERAKLPEDVQTTLTDCIKKINSDPEIGQAYMMIMNLTLLMVSIGFLLSILVVEFIIPLIFKNGQTLGKKIFSIAVVRVDGVRVTPTIMFVRAILGKYTIETMVPAVLILMMHFGVGSIITVGVLLLIAVFQLVLLIATKTNSLIHDAFSSTVVVDMQTQMIFDSVDAKIEYQKKLQSERRE